MIWLLTRTWGSNNQPGISSYYVLVQKQHRAFFCVSWWYPYLRNPWHRESREYAHTENTGIRYHPQNVALSQYLKDKLRWYRHTKHLLHAHQSCKQCNILKGLKDKLRWYRHIKQIMLRLHHSCQEDNCCCVWKISYDGIGTLNPALHSRSSYAPKLQYKTISIWTELIYDSLVIWLLTRT